jgi:Zn finger protein HypA/HybF involved in hydrogenase expression
MHEMGIAGSVLEAVHKEMHRYPLHRPMKIGLRIGEYAGIDEASLKFCFEALVKGTELEPLELAIEFCTVADGRRGDELEMSYLELDDQQEVKQGVGA